MKLTSIQVLDYNRFTAVLPLENGVTMLTGANASGKTMLTSVPSGILFNDIKLQSGASIGITWEAFDKQASMFVSKQGTKTTYRGTFDGVAKEHHTIKPSRAWLAQHFPVSQSVVNYVNHLAAFRSGTMLGGSPAARKELLADIVQLKIFEVLRKELNKLSTNAHVTVSMRNKLLADIAALEREAPKHKLIPLTETVDYLVDKRGQLKAQALRLEDVLEEDRPYAEIPTDKLEELLKLAPKRNRDWDRWEEFQDDGGKPPKNITDAQYKAASALASLGNMPSALSIIRGKLKPLPNVDKHVTALAENTVMINKIMTQLDGLRHSKDNSTCPTCDSTIDAKQLIKILKASLSALRAAENTLKANVNRAKATEAISSAVKAAKADKKLLPILVDSYNEVIEAYEAGQEIRDKWGNNFPQKPEKPRIDTDAIKQELRARRDYGQPEHVERKVSSIKDYYAVSTKLLNAVSELQEDQADARAAKRQLDRLRGELSALPHVEDAELLLDILKSLDNRQARDVYLELVADSLISALNELSPSFFDYKMEFAWHNGQLIANRKGAATDVVYLSGREGRTFMLLNAIALQQLLPPSRRLTTLALDEVEAGSSPNNRALLAELIPSMLDYYDNIVVITPLSKSEFNVDDSYRYRVTENKNKRQLVREE